MEHQHGCAVRGRQKDRGGVRAGALAGGGRLGALHSAVVDAGPCGSWMLITGEHGQLSAVPRGI